jgi:uncharacterized YccA/Bax inhibitor family protein
VPPIDPYFSAFSEQASPYIHQSGIIAIGFSLFVVIIAALNLDFDFIENAARSGTPEYMEWH